MKGMYCLQKHQSVIHVTEWPELRKSLAKQQSNKLDYSVLYFTLQAGQNHDSPSPRSLNINPLHFGQGLTSLMLIILPW